jgi:hypothetical protein
MREQQQQQQQGGAGMDPRFAKMHSEEKSESGDRQPLCRCAWGVQLTVLGAAAAALLLLSTWQLLCCMFVALSL